MKRNERCTFHFFSSREDPLAGFSTIYRTACVWTAYHAGCLVEYTFPLTARYATCCRTARQSIATPLMKINASVVTDDDVELSPRSIRLSSSLSSLSSPCTPPSLSFSCSRELVRKSGRGSLTAGISRRLSNVFLPRLVGIGPDKLAGVAKSELARRAFGVCVCPTLVGCYGAGARARGSLPSLFAGKAEPNSHGAQLARKISLLRVMKRRG